MIRNDNVLVALTPAKPIKLTTTGSDISGIEYAPVETNPNIIYGTSGNDKIVATANGTYGDPVIVKAGAGNDVVFGSCGVDHLFGGAGNDWMQTFGDYDQLFGGTGDDVLKGGGNVNLLEGGEGNDTLIAMAGSWGNHVEGGAGNDLIVGSAEGGWFDGGIGNDKLIIANGGADGASVEEQSLYIGGAGWDLAKLDNAKFGQDAWIETNKYGLDELHWFNMAGQEQVDIIHEIEQFDISGTYYTYDQLLI